jgi:hypothetical protein
MEDGFLDDARSRNVFAVPDVLFVFLGCEQVPRRRDRNQGCANEYQTAKTLPWNAGMK